MKRAALWVVASVVALCVASVAGGEDVTYRKHIKPVFDAKCLSCHGSDSAPELGDYKEAKDAWLAKGKGMRMDTYSHLLFYVTWPDTGALMRRLDDGSGTKDGKPGNMHQHLGKTDDDRAKTLAVFKEWVGHWTLKRRNEVTKEELDAIKAKY